MTTELEIANKPITTIESIKKFVKYTHDTLKISWHPDDGFMTIADNGTGELIAYEMRASLENRLDEIYKIIEDENVNFIEDTLYAFMFKSLDEFHTVSKRHRQLDVRSKLEACRP